MGGSEQLFTEGSALHVGGRKWPPGKEFTGRVVRKVVIRNVDGKEAEHSWGESTG